MACFRPGSLLVALGAGLSLALPAAGAEPEAEPGEAPWERPAWERLTAEPAYADGPETFLGERVHVRKGVGLELRSEWKVRGRPLELGVQGPVMRKKKRLGLTVELRF